MVFLCESLHLTILAVTIQSGEGYKVTRPNKFVYCKTGISLHKLECFDALFGLAS